jgi:FtsP/CotA-like multicopper oxidase with cupredoxin domain
VFYAKSAEGALYDEATSGRAKLDDGVPPGGTYIYVWPVPDRAGPGPNDPSSIVWPYHSHTHEWRDVNAGLIGPIIVARRGAARPDGAPKGIDRELVTLFGVFNENESSYTPENADDFHAAHWHGATVLIAGQRTDLANLAVPLATATADMVTDAAGIWMLHCHVAEHIQGGMTARFAVVER